MNNFQTCNCFAEKEKPSHEGLILFPTWRNPISFISYCHCVIHYAKSKLRLIKFEQYGRRLVMDKIIFYIITIIGWWEIYPNLFPFIILLNKLNRRY